jgi:DNA-binding response OmpR family regulator
MAKILVVEDDPIVASMVADALEFGSHSVEMLTDGLEAQAFLKTYTYDLLILDVELPGMTGFEICRAFRGGGGKAPVLMLTGKSTITDKTDGFEAGADDYLTKPFHVKELLLRVQALLKRASPSSEPVLKASDLVLDPSAFKITKNGGELRLTPVEFALLEFLMRHPGRVFSPEALINSAWPSSSERSPETVRTCVKKLRDKIDTKGLPSIITNAPGVGYKLET